MDFATLYTNWRSRTALGRLWKTVRAIGACEDALLPLSDEELRSEFHALRDATSRPDGLARAFAIVREASKRTLGLRQFDVQLLGGLTLLQGKLAEMRTGEGKTLTIVAPACVLALHGKGVHVVTSNSYLAERDAQLMRPVYQFLGLSVAHIEQGQSIEQKQAAYGADITYGVGFEFGFDYLRDNLARSLAQRCQRGQFAAIVDEVDSILIDEARTPLIISGAAESQADAIRAIDQVIRGLKQGTHYLINQKEHSATLTEEGYRLAEEGIAAAGLTGGASLYAPQNLHLVRQLHACVKAHGLYRLDRDYVVELDEILLVDRGTGRKMKGRRLEDGLHEAIEAKERVSVQAGTQTRATITYQNYFGQYERLAGLTGTALTEAEEFTEFYGLETVVIPTNRPLARIQLEDLVFPTKSAKFLAVVEEVATRHAKGQPVLIGCATVRDADLVSHLLSQHGLKHEVLSAKHIEREAIIIAAAGEPGAITVATNMAGRGTDIALGGEKPHRSHFESDAELEASLARWESDKQRVLQAGGLFVLGTERNGIRRVDNQLAGRSGRQGDPGEVQFFLSLEDDMLKLFSQSKKLGMAQQLLTGDTGPLSGKTVTALVTAAQRRVENEGFDARRNLMKFDTALSDQRKAVYQARNELLEQGAEAFVQQRIRDALASWCDERLDPHQLEEQWDLARAKRELQDDFGLDVPLVGWIHKEELSREDLVARLEALAVGQYESFGWDGADLLTLVLDVLSDLWTGHLTALDELRHNVSLKGNTGQNPVFAFNNDAFQLFKQFDTGLSFEIARQALSPAKQEARAAQEKVVSAEKAAFARVAVEMEKRHIHRNEPCPCGSGLKFKNCHGKLR